MSFFSSKNKSELSLVFDIRDSSVTIAAAKFEKCLPAQAGERPELVLCQNFPIQIEDVSDHQKYLNAMLSTLDQAVLSMRKTLVKIGNTEKIRNNFFFIGSPWSITQSKLIKVVKDRPFVINNSFLEKIISGEESDAEKSIQQASLPGSWQVLEQKIIQSKLNGYTIEKIFGKKTTDLEIELFVSFIPSEVKNKIYSFVDENLGKRAEKHSSSCVLSSYSFLRDMFPKTIDFIYIDIGDFLTDIYVVKDNVIFAIASMPLGEKNILQLAAKSSKTSEYLISSAMAIHNSENYDANAKKDFEKNIGPGILEWSSSLGGLLSKLCNESILPKDLFVIPRNDISCFIMKEISNKKEYSVKVSKTEIKTHIINEQAVNSQVINGRIFANEPNIKVDIAFLNKGMQ